MRSLPLALAAAVLGHGASTASAADQPTTANNFGCTGDTKYQGDQAPTWSTTKPAASVQSGAGCGSLDLGPVQDDVNGHRVDFVGGGTHDGEIRSVTVELYSLALSQARVPADYPGIFTLSIDGEEVARDETSRIAGEKVNTGGGTEKLVFSFSHAVPTDEETGEPTGPAPSLAGPGKHTISVSFTSRTVEYQNLWVWGTSEVPAGVTINAATPGGLQIVF
jgi:hypothetical protein